MLLGSAALPARRAPQVAYLCVCTEYLLERQISCESGLIARWQSCCSVFLFLEYALCLSQSRVHCALSLLSALLYGLEPIYCSLIYVSLFDWPRRQPLRVGTHILLASLCQSIWLAKETATTSRGEKLPTNIMEHIMSIFLLLHNTIYNQSAYL